MAKVDVIIPAYNAARFLPAALDSVLAQTFPDWQIVLVDDGSVDGTADLVAGYTEKLGGRLTYIRQANAGLPAARNRAIRSASSEFLALLDADDVWLPRRLEASLESFAGNPKAGLSYGLIEQIDMEGVVRRTFGRRRRYPEGKVASAIYRRTMDLPCPTVTFRRESVGQVGMFDETMRATEDRDLWLRIAQRYEVAFVPEVIAHYRVSPQAMTTDPNRMFAAQMQFVDKHYGTPGCGFWSRRVALSCIYRQKAEALATRGDLPSAVRDALQAVMLDPLQGKSLRTAGSLLVRSAARRFGRSEASEVSR